MQGDRDVNTSNIVIANECDACQPCQRGEQRARWWAGGPAVDGPAHGQDLGNFEPKRDCGTSAARYGRDGRPAIAEGGGAAATAGDAASGGRWQGAPSGYAGKCEPGAHLTIRTQMSDPGSNLKCQFPIRFPLEPQRQSCQAARSG